MKSKKNSRQARSAVTSSDATSAARADFDSTYRRLSNREREGYYTADQWTDMLTTDSRPYAAKVRAWIKRLISEGKAEVGKVMEKDIAGRVNWRPAYRVKLCDS